VLQAAEWLKRIEVIPEPNEVVERVVLYESNCMVGVAGEHYRRGT